MTQKSEMKIAKHLYFFCFLLIFYSFFLSTTEAQLAVYDGEEWPKTDFDQSSVNPDEIYSGGPGKDAIPAIDHPQFIPAAEAYGWLDFKEPVVVVKMDKVARAYPLQILIYHEIVNDTLSGIPISVTFCPLCNAAIAFERVVNKRVIDFGTTGRLRKSGMIMYDRQTESWWQQFTGEAIVGELSGNRLRSVPANIISFEDFLLAYPEGDVLSKETGYSRAYGSNPYRGYDKIDDQPFLLNQPADKRLPPMERVVAVQSSGLTRLYPFSLFKTTGIIEDRVGKLDVIIFSKEGVYSALDASEIVASKTVFSATAWNRKLDGTVLNFKVVDGRILDKNTGSEWNVLGQAVTGPLKGKQLQAVNSGAHFAFAWLAFQPRAGIYSIE